MKFDFSKEEANYKTLVASGGHGGTAGHQQMLMGVGEIDAGLLLLSKEERNKFIEENPDFFNGFVWLYYQGWRKARAKSCAHLLDMYKLLNVKLYTEHFVGETFYAGIPLVTIEEINEAIDLHAEPDTQYGGKGTANGCSGLEKVGIDGKLHPCDEDGRFKLMLDFNDIYGDGTMVTKQELDDYCGN